jgi:hypothetical protein
MGSEKMIFLRYGSKMDERIIEFDAVSQQQEHHCQNQTTGIGAAQEGFSACRLGRRISYDEL